MVTCIHSYVDVLGSLFNCSLAHSHMTCTDYSQLKSYLLLVTCISVCIHSFKPITYSISLCTLLLHVDIVGWFHCHMTCIDYCQSSSLSLVTFISVDIHLYVFTFTCWHTWVTFNCLPPSVWPTVNSTAVITWIVLHSDDMYILTTCICNYILMLIVIIFQLYLYIIVFWCWF